MDWEIHYFETMTALAEQGDADAPSMLSQIYDIYIGTAQIDQEAERWYRLAAQQGEAGDQYYLGTMYAKVRGVVLSNSRAYIWYSVAAAQMTSAQGTVSPSWADAVEARDRLGPQLSPQATPKLVSGFIEPLHST